MMHLPVDQSRYAVVDGVQVLDKTYGNGDLSLIVLLPPGTPTGLAELESSLTEAQLAKWLTAEDSSQVEVFLPRFELESAFNLRREFEALGMPTAFQYPEADFTGMSQKQRLALGGVIHKAMARFDEQGPGDGPGVGNPGSSEQRAAAEKPPIRRADHPFLFLIRNNRTGSIVFIGRVVNPQDTASRHK